MKPVRVRYWVVFLAAMFLANGAAAAARACLVDLAAQEHAAIQVLDTSGGEHLCPDTDSAANCLSHCTQSSKSEQQNLSFDVPVFAVAPPLALHRVWLPTDPGRLVIASGQPVVGPPLTILFRKLRN